MKKYTKLISVMLLTFLATTNAFSQKDIPSLEALIYKHYKGKDILNERERKSAATMTIANQVSSLTKKYEEVEKKLSQRIKTGYNALEFAWEVSEIIQQTTKTPKLIGEYGDLVIKHNLKNPLLLKYYNASYKRIKAELEMCQKILATGTLMKGNFKEKYETLIAIKTAILNINYHLETAIYMIKGIASLNMNFAHGLYEFLSDDEYNRMSKQIADKIINDYSRKR